MGNGRNILRGGDGAEGVFEEVDEAVVVRVESVGGEAFIVGCAEVKLAPSFDGGLAIHGDAVGLGGDAILRGDDDDDEVESGRETHAATRGAGGHGDGVDGNGGVRIRRRGHEGECGDGVRNGCRVGRHVASEGRCRRCCAETHGSEIGIAGDGAGHHLELRVAVERDELIAHTDATEDDVCG